MRRDISRRGLLGAAGAVGLTLFTSRKGLAAEAAPGADVAKASKLNVAFVGVGGRGAADLAGIAQHVNVVGLCDVDSKTLAGAAKTHTGAKTYGDYRKMLEDHKSFDAVCVATPDHMHAPVAMAAMQLGKHVYCEKPIAHDVFEVRAMTEMARKMKVMTQMGTQAHASEGTRLVVEFIKAGAIGNVKEVHVWTDRPIWPQGFKRPELTGKPPENLNWDLWLGTAPQHPYYITDKGVSPIHPFKWRGWWDFGTGALGDMGCHIFDASYWACGLTAPTSIEAESQGMTDVAAPNWSIIKYDFPATSERGPIKLTWSDGGKRPPRPEGMDEGLELPIKDGGTVFIGDKGIMVVPYGGAPRLVPEARMKDYKKPEPTIKRVPGGPAGHHKDWVDAITEGRPAGSNFDYAGPLTEIVLLGNVAIRAGKRIVWDSAKLEITNEPGLDALIRREYRQGW